MKRMMLVAVAATALCCGDVFAQCNLLNRFVGRSGCCETTPCCTTPASSCDVGCGRCRGFSFNLNFSFGCNQGCGRVRGLFPLFGGSCGDTCCQPAPVATDCCDRGSLFGCGGRFGGFGGFRGCGCNDCCTDPCDPCGGGTFRGLLTRIGSRGCCDTGNDCCADDCCGRRLFDGCGIGTRQVCMTVPCFGLTDRVRSIGRRGCCASDCCGGDVQPQATPDAVEPQPEAAAEGAQTRIVPIVDPSAFRAPTTRLTSGRNN